MSRTGADPRPDRAAVTSGAAIDRGRVAWLAAGALAFLGGTALGWSSGLLDAIVGPPALVRAALVGASVVVGLGLIGRSIRMLEHRPGARAADLSAADLAVLVRGVRLVFLAVAAFSAGAGWLLAHPLPFIVALVIAGVDVLETSFLLLVVAVRRER